MLVYLNDVPEEFGGHTVSIHKIARGVQYAHGPPWSPSLAPLQPLTTHPAHPPPHTHTPLQVFPKLELKLSPKARAAITFNDCLPNGQEDPRTLHGGSPPTNGTKIAINIWIRAQSFSRGFM